MNSIGQYFSLAIEPLGYALLHSLWQGVLVMVLLFAVLKIFKLEKPSIRYQFGVAALLLLAITSLITFNYYYQQKLFTPQLGGATAITFQSQFDLTSAVVITDYLQLNFNYIIGLWLLGVSIMSVRFLGGWLYLIKLKNKATDCVNHDLVEQLAALKKRLAINQSIRLKISAAIDVPMVIGTLKPVILLPVTMLTGMSASQIEMVLAHELAHIKRYDFLINLFQYGMETLLFFNPTVWMISNFVRSEREHACDDLALDVTGDALAFAQTLAHVETIRLSPNMAMQFAHKNNLLNRIKRLTGMKTQNVIDLKIMGLLVVATVMMSFGWYSINSNKEAETVPTMEEPLMVNTFTPTPNNSQQSADQTTATAKKVIEPKILPVPPKEIPADSTEKEEQWRRRNHHPAPPMPPRALEDWSEEFAEKFAARFKEFYDEHGEELEELIKEMQEEFPAHRREEMRAMAHEMRARAMEMRDRHREDEEFAMHHARRMSEEAKVNMQKQEEQLKIMQEELKKHEAEIKLMQENLEKFEVELKDMLVADGYLKKKESLENFEFDRSGTVWVNDQEVKPEHAEKYKELYKKHFKEAPRGMRYRR